MECLKDKQTDKTANFFQALYKRGQKCHIQLQQRFWFVVCKPSHRKFRWYERLGFNKKKIGDACLSV